MTAPVPPGDREALAEWLYDTWMDALPFDPTPMWNEGQVLSQTWPALADLILARWRLVPVEQEPNG